ncbi:MAG: acyltransferase [Erysipelotrichaceae bacterium]|nr:acyltransferase [Erysipelotrichaceae bacterium]
MEQQFITLHQKKHIRSTNLQCIRFIAAMLVIICHAYPLCLGSGFQDMLGDFTNGSVTFGGFAVAVFFFISGFYAIQSMQRVRSWLHFLTKKLKRMLPSLLLVVFVCTFVIGPMVSNLTFFTYLVDMDTYRYLLNGVFILQHNLPGVFTHNIYGSVVNGALWTMPLEFVCLIACACFVSMKLDTRKRYLFVLSLLVVGFIAMNIIYGNGSFFMSVLLPCMMFYIGIGFSIFDQSIVLDVRYFILFLLLGSVVFCFYAYFGCMILLPYFLIYVSYGIKQKGKVFAYLGDASYEMYLWGFVIQQLIVMFNGGSMDVGTHLMIALPCVILAGCLTHFCLMSRKGAFS